MVHLYKYTNVHVLFAVYSTLYIYIYTLPVPMVHDYVLHYVVMGNTTSLKYALTCSLASAVVVFDDCFLALNNALHIDGML
jgi:hypothetical protein